MFNITPTKIIVLLMVWVTVNIVKVAADAGLRMLALIG